MPDSDNDDLELLLLEQEQRRRLASRKEVTSEPTIETKQPFSKTESVARGAAQNATLGFGDEASAALELGLGKLTGNEAYKDATYSKLRDENRADNAQAQKDNPWSYGIGQVLGGLPSAIATGGATSTPAMLATGAGMGAATGLGLSESDNASGMAKDTGIGAGFGLAGASLAKLVSKFGPDAIAKVAPKLAKRLGLRAESLAENAVGATASQAEKMQPGTGRFLLDNDIVNAGSSQRNIADNAARMMGKATGEIDEVMATLDKSGRGIDPQKILNKIDDKIAELVQDPSQASVVRQLNGYKEDIINAWSQGEGGNILPSAAEKTKRGYQSIARKAYGDPDRQLATKATGSIYRQSVEDAAEELSPDLAAKFNTAKETYGMLSPVEEAAERRALVVNQSPIGGPGDMMMAAGGVIASGGNPLGALAPVARRVVPPRIASTLAVGADKASRGMSALPGIANTAKPYMSGAIQSGSRSATQKVIENKKKQDQDIPIDRMGKFSSSLMKAKERGPQALAVANYVLTNSNPEYREMLRQQKEEGEQYYG